MIKILAIAIIGCSNYNYNILEAKKQHEDIKVLKIKYQRCMDVLRGGISLTTPITLTAGKVIIKTLLNHTIAAQDLKKRLPLKLSACRSSNGYTCMTACGVFDPTETQSGWKNGDISIAGGRLHIFFDGEAASKKHWRMMVIAHLDETALEQVRALPELIQLKIELETV